MTRNYDQADVDTLGREVRAFFEEQHGKSGVQTMTHCRKGADFCVISIAGRRAHELGMEIRAYLRTVLGDPKASVRIWKDSREDRAPKRSEN